MSSDELLNSVDSVLNCKKFKIGSKNNCLNDDVEKLNLLKTESESSTSNHKQIPLHHLPQSLQSVVLAVEQQVQCPRELAFQGVMSALSIAVSSHTDVQMFMTNNSMPMTLMMMSAAISGDRKTTSDSLCHKGIRQAAHELAKGEALNWRASDLTVEGAMKAFDTTPIIALNNGDAASFFNSHAMKRINVNQTIAFLSDVWSGEPQSHLRSLDHRSTSDPRLSASLLTQESYMRDFLADERFASQGIAARFLYMTTISKQGTRMIDPEASVVGISDSISKFQDETRRLFIDGVTRWRAGDERRVVTVSAKAMRFFIEFYNQIEEASGPSQKYRGNPWAQRAPEHGNRLAGLFAAYRGDSKITFEDSISGCSLAQHFLDSYIDLVSWGLEDRDIGRAYELLEKIRSKGMTSVRSVVQSKTFGNAKDVKKLVRLLVEKGEAEWTAGYAGNETHFRV